MAYHPGERPEHDGPYGPGSVAWRIIGHPAALIGGMRALMVQALEPHAMAGVFAYSDFTARPLDRLRRTMQYVGAVTFGTHAEADAAAALVRRVHENVHGTDPVTGTPFSATDPETLLWVHLAEYHSYLVAYEAFAGRVSRPDADEYFATTARAVVALGTPRELVPSTREDVTAYFAAMRPRLCVSELARETIDFVRFPPVTRELLPYQVPVRLASAAAVAILPGHVRHLIGVDRPRVLDLPTRMAVLTGVQALSAGLRLTMGRDGHATRGRGRTPAFVPHAVEHGFV
jgi:uncharacterized protein (DUF2236 family)